MFYKCFLALAKKPKVRKEISEQDIFCARVSQLHGANLRQNNPNGSVPTILNVPPKSVLTGKIQDLNSFWLLI